MISDKIKSLAIVLIILFGIYQTPLILEGARPEHVTLIPSSFPTPLGPKWSRVKREHMELVLKYYFK
jgi:hypothetical protein